MATTKNTLQRNLNEFLRQYRRASHTTTGQPPSQLFLGRNLRIRLDLMRHYDRKPAGAVKPSNQGILCFRTFQSSQAVYFLSSNPRMDWLLGVIATRLGDLHYKIEYNGRHLKRYIDQIRSHQVDRKTIELTRLASRESLSKTISERSRRIQYYKRTGVTSPVCPSVVAAASPANAPTQGATLASIPAPTPRHSQQPQRPPWRFLKN